MRRIPSRAWGKDIVYEIWLTKRPENRRSLVESKLRQAGAWSDEKS
jgi:hypothetical protein